jgi:hypothetical protein
MSKYEPGCYGDGTFGHQNTRHRCAEQISHVLAHVVYGNWSSLAVAIAPVITSLHGEMPDDNWDELEACDWLNQHAPVEGCSWGWRDGDFGLWYPSAGEE